MRPNKIWIDNISAADVAVEFPCALTPDIQAGLALRNFQPGYPSLGTLDHVLLARTDAIVGVTINVTWRVWTGDAWVDMAIVNSHLLHRLMTLPVGWR